MNQDRTQRSAYTCLFEKFGYSATSLVPPGTKILMHSKPWVTSSWELNGEECWTIGSSLELYRCIKCYFSKIRSVRDIDTITFFPKVISFPKVTTDNFLRQVAEDIISILTAPPTPTTPSLEVGNTIRNELLKIATVLKIIDILPVISLSCSQNDTESPRVDTQVHHPTQQRTLSLCTITTPTSNIHVPPPRVVSPTLAPTPVLLPS